MDIWLRGIGGFLLAASPLAFCYLILSLIPPETPHLGAIPLIAFGFSIVNLIGGCLIQSGIWVMVKKQT